MNGAAASAGGASWIRQSVHFGFDLEPEVDAHLQQAAERVGRREDSLAALNRALRAAPDRLEVLIALYKFHFYRGELGKARDFVFQALIKASHQGGFSHHWQELTPDSAAWSDPRGPARQFLYSLKALAFIRLRENDTSDAAAILAALERLDPNDQVGADVIRDLLAGMLDDE